MEEASTEDFEIMEEENSSFHIDSQECNCPDCKSRKRSYIQILDMNRYVEHLNDWD
ncbi:MAG: hypothetical protein HDS84_08035 [Bacteroidales bacterium]|nr:hypothetical protein [Bacteroidales bacterium]MBD5301934.1 hypothetical protein [Bacteroides sp.]